MQSEGPARNIPPTGLHYMFRPSGTPYHPPPCECHDCGNSFFLADEQDLDCLCYTRDVEDKEAKKIIEGLIKSIHDDRIFLKQQSEAHGDSIISRWKKKTQSKRAALILQAEPELCKEQWFIPKRTHAQATWRDSRQHHRKSYLLPYLNVEILQKTPMALISLISNRTRYAPEDWVPFDSNEITTSWETGNLDVEFNKACVVMYGADFGKFTPWVAEQMHRGDIIGYPRARLVLEAQATLIKLLRRAVEILLGDSLLQAPPTPNAKWLETAKNGSRKGEEAEYWSQYACQPFSPPPQFDIDDLCSQVKARADAMGDHLWLLQTEPSYLGHQIKAISKLETFKVVGNEDYGRYLVREVNADIHVNWWWQWVCEEMEGVRRLYSLHRDSIRPGRPIPQEYDEALARLELSLVNMMHHITRQLTMIIPQSPGFRHLHDFKYERDDISGRISISRKPKILNIADVFTQEPLLWCLTQLQSGPDLPRRYNHAMLFHFLDEHLALSSARERARLDEVIYKKLSDVAAIYGLLMTVRFSRPQNTSGQMTDVIKKGVGGFARHFAAKVIDIELDTTLTNLLQAFREASLPSGGKDRNWLSGFNAVHLKLQSFWNEVHRRLHATLKESGLSIRDIERRLECVKHWSSPEYRSRLRSKQETVLAEIAKATVLANDDYFLPLPHSRSEVTDFRPTEQRVKTKTRGEDLPTADLPILEDLDSPSPRPMIQVNKRALTTFRAMFPSSLEERNKIVDWSTFVLSMNDVGFSARSSGGSAFCFEKNDDGQGTHGKIIFHKPHPVAKIDPIMFQSMGRRMNRRFEWHRELFAAEGK